MDEYIKRGAAIEFVQEKLRICEALPNSIAKTAALLTLKSTQDSLESIPAADVRPVVRGKWSRVYDDFMKSHYDTCSCCGKEYFGANGFNFCPNCGADMREGS